MVLPDGRGLHLLSNVGTIHRKMKWRWHKVSVEVSALRIDLLRDRAADEQKHRDNELTNVSLEMQVFCRAYQHYKHLTKRHAHGFCLNSAQSEPITAIAKVGLCISDLRTVTIMATRKVEASVGVS